MAVIARSILSGAAFFAAQSKDATKQSHRCNQEIAAISIASQTALAMTPPKILAINANVAE
ncbi:MAG: hypothetical protein CVU38_09515 [Chloroflexi bacterium HGW-Chloroflexi-1]|nr:MAG: hypothetical protein CVU38_09515 [Chloroflexi bacterium HGW-Chloroflexi-1]